MRRKLLVLTIAGLCLSYSMQSLAARPLGSHQAEPIVASPVSSASPAGVPFIRGVDGPVISPGIALTAPIAFGADWGHVFAGLGGNYDTDSNGRSTDGSGYLGLGLGDAEKWVGLEAVVNIISASDDFFDETSINLKLHRQLGERTAIAIGTENIARRGTVFPDESYEYAALSHVFTLNAGDPAGLMSLPVTIGAGKGRFSELLDAPARGYEDDVEAFAAVGFIPHPQISVIGEWLGNQLNVGASFVPFRRWPLVVTAGFLDLTEENDDKADFALAIGYTFDFKK